MIPEGSKIPNLKYAPIMNIYNDDEIMVMFTSEETNMYKYGTNVHMSLSENLTSKVKTAFRNVHKSNYDTLSAKKAKQFIYDYLLDIKEGIVYGMAGTLVLTDVFSGETDADKQALLDYWKPLYEKTKDENYNEYVKIIDLRLSGIKLDSFEDYVAYLMSLNELGVNAVTPPSNPPDNTINSGTITYDRELIKTIVSAAKFYINHIPTYQGKLKTRVSGNEIINYENNLAYNHLANYLEEYVNPTNTDTVEYSADHKITTIKTYENGKLKATREFNTISEDTGKPMYFRSNMGYYKWKDMINDGNSYNVKTDFTGWDYAYDDCSGSIEFIINIRGSDENAILPNKVTTADFMSRAKTNNTAKVLYNNGYICYYKKDGIWYESTGLNDSDEKPNTEIATKGINFLQPGDLLFCAGDPGHGEYYVGDGYTVDYVDEEARTNDEKKKSGISKITAPTSFSAPKGLKAEGTFSWGSVRDEFPTESSSGDRHYFYYDTTNNVFRHCECGNEPNAKSKTKFDTNGLPISIHDEASKDCKFNSREYTVIWRKK